MNQFTHPEGLSMLEKRQIEAEILKEVYETLKESHGEEVARTTIAEFGAPIGHRAGACLRRRGAGRHVAKGLPGRDAAVDQGRRARDRGQGADRASFTFNVVRCRYAETYKAMGLGEIGHLLSCNRDGAFCEGYDPKLKLERTQTIMQGASHCDFKYRYED